MDPQDFAKLLLLMLNKRFSLEDMSNILGLSVMQTKEYTVTDKEHNLVTDDKFMVFFIIKRIAFITELTKTDRTARMLILMQV